MKSIIQSTSIKAILLTVAVTLLTAGTSLAQNQENKPAFPPFTAWLQVKAVELGPGWHTGWMSVNPAGAKCYLISFVKEPKMKGEGKTWLYLAYVEKIRFQPLPWFEGDKNKETLKKLAKLPAEKWVPISISEVRKIDERHGCKEWETKSQSKSI